MLSAVPYRVRPLIELAVSSIVGGNRCVNEDAWGADVKAGLAVVADGCGGTADGSWAAKLAVAYVLQHGRGAVGAADSLALAIERANAEIFAQATSERQKRGTGTTVAALRVDETTIAIGWVGDCRVYEYSTGHSDATAGRDRHGGLFEPRTRDHTLANEPGYTPPEAGSDGDMGSILLRVVGVSSAVSIELCYQPRRADSLYLIASDGLTTQLSRAAIHRIVADPTLPLQARCDALVEAADRVHGADNVTVMLVRPI